METKSLSRKVINLRSAEIYMDLCAFFAVIYRAATQQLCFTVGLFGADIKKHPLSWQMCIEQIWYILQKVFFVVVIFNF